jgi:hypothetical protein
MALMVRESYVERTGTSWTMSVQGGIRAQETRDWVRKRSLSGRRSHRDSSEDFRIHACRGAGFGIGEYGSPAV